MAETITMAKVRIDASGVVSGIDKAEAALKRGESGVKNFGKSAQASTGLVSKFGGELFNLQSALTTLAGTLGVIAVVTALGLALKNMVSDLVSSVEWFQKLKVSVTDTWRAFALGETAVEAMGRKLSKFGVTDLFKVRENLKLATTQLEIFQKEIETGVRAFDKIRAQVQLFLFGSLPAIEIINAADLALAQRQIDLFLPKIKQMRDLLSGVKTAADGLNIEPFNPFTTLGIADGKRFTNVLFDNARAIAEMRDLYDQGAISLTRFDNAQKSAVANIKAIGAGLNDIRAIGPELGSQLEISFEKFGMGIDKSKDKLQGFNNKLLQMGAIATQAASLLGQAFSGGLAGMRQQIGALLSFVAILAQSRVIMYTAMAAAALTGAGAIVEGGPPNQFALAAALWQKVAIISGAGAAFLAASGAGGGGGGGGGGQVGPAGPPQGSVTQAGPTFILNVEGSMIGTDSQTLIREFKKLLDTVVEDGG